MIRDRGSKTKAIVESVEQACFSPGKPVPPPVIQVEQSRVGRQRSLEWGLNYFLSNELQTADLGRKAFRVEKFPKLLLEEGGVLSFDPDVPSPPWYYDSCLFLDQMHFTKLAYRSLKVDCVPDSETVDHCRVDISIEQADLRFGRVLVTKSLKEITGEDSLRLNAGGWDDANDANDLNCRLTEAEIAEHLLLGYNAVDLNILGPESSRVLDLSIEFKIPLARNTDVSSPIILDLAQNIIAKALFRKRLDAGPVQSPIRLDVANIDAMIDTKIESLVQLKLPKDQILVLVKEYRETLLQRHKGDFYGSIHAFGLLAMVNYFIDGFVEGGFDDDVEDILSSVVANILSTSLTRTLDHYLHKIPLLSTSFTIDVEGNSRRTAMTSLHQSLTVIESQLAKFVGQAKKSKTFRTYIKQQLQVAFHNYQFIQKEATSEPKQHFLELTQKYAPLTRSIDKKLSKLLAEMGDCLRSASCKKLENPHVNHVKQQKYQISDVRGFSEMAVENQQISISNCLDDDDNWLKPIHAPTQSMLNPEIADVAIKFSLQSLNDAIKATYASSPYRVDGVRNPKFFWDKRNACLGVGFDINQKMLFVIPIRGTLNTCLIFDVLAQGPLTVSLNEWEFKARYKIFGFLSKNSFFDGLLSLVMEPIYLALNLVQVVTISPIASVAENIVSDREVSRIDNGMAVENFHISHENQDLIIQLKIRSYQEAQVLLRRLEEGL